MNEEQTQTDAVSHKGKEHDSARAGRPHYLRPADVIYWLTHWMVYLFLYSLLIVWLSLIGAMFGGILGERGKHWGWIAGAIVALLGVPAGQVSFGSKISHPPWRPRPLPPDPEPVVSEAHARKDRPIWVTREAMFGALGGVLLGGFLGFLVLVPCWFSISMSPFAPKAWSESVSYTDPAEPRGSMDHNMDEGERVGVQTKHPLVFILGLGPPVMLSLLGFILAGLGVLGVQYGSKSASTHSKKKARKRITRLHAEQSPDQGLP